MISNRDYFNFTPANIYLAMGWRKFEDVILPLQPILAKAKIDFIKAEAKQIQPEKNTIILGKNDDPINYNYLVIATGPKLNYDIEGQKGHTIKVCNAEDAEKAKEKIQQFIQDPGPVVIGAAPGVSCFGPAYELAFLLNHKLKKEKIRDQVEILFLTSEPFIGHFGLGGVGNSQQLMEKHMKKRNIQYKTNVKITKITNDKVIYTNTEGETFEAEAKLNGIFPRFIGQDIIATAGKGVAHPENNKLIVDKCFKNPKYPNIYGVGVAVHIPPVEKTPIPTGTPITGQMTEGMAAAISHNIINEIKGKKERYSPTLAAICIGDMDNKAVGYVANPVLPPRKSIKTFEGRIVHLAKIIFEKYFLLESQKKKYLSMVRKPRTTNNVRTKTISTM